MAFNPQATYYGGQLLGQGLANLGQGIAGTIQGFQDIDEKGKKARALMTYLHQQTDPVTGKPVIDDKTMESFMHLNSRDQAFVAGGRQAGMQLFEHLQRYAIENRETLAKTNLYGAEAEKARADTTPFEPTTSVVKDPQTGEYHTFVQTSRNTVRPLKETPPDGTIVIDTDRNPVGQWSNGKFIRFTAPTDPMKKAIAEQITGAGGGSPTPTPAPSAAPAQTAAPVRVNTVAEAQALPPGTLFIGGDDKLHRR